ncbi:unnamed protein product [Malus baccata var. baccata]
MARASAPAVFPWKYHVFLSFRGEDTRRGFTDHLYKQLEARGIKTFRDEPELKRGTDINPELLRAIDQSMSAIICLRELTHIVRCMEERKRIFPIFYGVDPSDVRHQRGSFGEAFAELEVNYREEVNEWRKSLERVANLAGWNSKDCRYDTQLIQRIVNTLWGKVHPTFSLLDSSERFVGIDSKLEEIDLLLDTDANDVRFIGIWGMGGVGKTTLANLVYKRISHDFEGSSFLANVREVCSKGGIAHLQKQLLSEILGENNIQIWNAYSGITRISRCLCNKKVLLILNDVDQLDQLEKLVNKKEWFGFGSRVVVTTRDERLLVEHGIEMVYEVKPLTQDEALSLFRLKTFKDVELEEDFFRTSGATNAPLGSLLYKTGRDDWKSALDKLKQAPKKVPYPHLWRGCSSFHHFCGKERIIERLEDYGFVGGARMVVDVLIEKSLLSISDSYVYMHDLIQEMAWEIVRRESYHEPGGRSRLWLRNDILHVLAENTGSEAIEGIVLCLSEFEEAQCNPEAFTKMCKLRLLHIYNASLSKGPNYLPNALRELKWSWYPSKCLPPTFQPDELTELSLRHSKIDHLWDGIKRLGKLRSIDLSYSHNLTTTPDFTGVQNLEELVLQGCTNLAKIYSSIAFLRRLRILNLKDCKSIMSLPNKVEMESLEVFDIFGGSKVKKIPEFVGEMKNFSRLSLSRTVVQEMPTSVIRGSLEELDLMKNLVLSNFLGCNAPPARSWRSFFTFGEFPTKISQPVSLILASLKDICFLKDLNLEDCNLCEGAIPEDIGFLSSLERLNLSGNHFVSLPASISGLSKLTYFQLRNELQIDTDNCTSLKMLPSIPHACRLSKFLLTSINCFSLAGNQGCNAMIYSELKRFLQVFLFLLSSPVSLVVYIYLRCSFVQELPHFLRYFIIVIPGSEIPEWFNNQSMEDSLIQKLPSHSCKSKWMGLALCALLEAAQNISVPTREVMGHEIMCYPSFGSNTTFPASGWCTGVGVMLSEIASYHLCLVFLSRKFLGTNHWEEKCWDQIRFHFKTYDVGNQTPFKVNSWIKLFVSSLDMKSY